NEVHVFHTAITNLNTNFILGTLYPLAFSTLPYSSGTAYLSGQTYNVGNGVSNKISEIIIASGGALKINADENLGLSGGGNSNPHPVSGSFFSAHTSGSSCFGSIGVLIESGGLLQVGDNSNSNTG